MSINLLIPWFFHTFSSYPSYRFQQSAATVLESANTMGLPLCLRLHLILKSSVKSVRGSMHVKDLRTAPISVAVPATPDGPASI